MLALAKVKGSRSRLNPLRPGSPEGPGRLPGEGGSGGRESAGRARSLWLPRRRPPLPAVARSPAARAAGPRGEGEPPFHPEDRLPCVCPPPPAQGNRWQRYRRGAISERGCRRQSGAGWGAPTSAGSVLRRSLARCALAENSGRAKNPTRQPGWRAGAGAAGEPSSAKGPKDPRGRPPSRDPKSRRRRRSALFGKERRPGELARGPRQRGEPGLKVRNVPFF